MIWLQLAILLLAATASSFLASLLSSAWKKRKKTEAETLRIEGMLPGYDCGLCGRGDCRSYAAAIDQEGADPALCGPGGSRIEALLRAHLSQRPGDTRGLALRAVVRCGGSEGAARPAFRYDGRADCRSVSELYGGPKRCKEGCLGYASCAAVCDRGAISVSSGLAIVNPALCTGCGNCVEACPKNLISLLPRGQSWYVACSSRREVEAREADCSVACNACGECSRRSERAQFLLEASLARENSESTGEGWAEIAAACPTGAIVLAGAEKKRPSPFRKKAR
jgi:Na+-translocating ferredoxin:NAD+ oxidoreductase RNF subunit RnfB